MAKILRKPFVSRHREIKSLVDIGIQTLEAPNAYTDFIDQLKNKDYENEGTSGKVMVYHHTIPISHGGLDNEESYVYISPI